MKIRCKSMLGTSHSWAITVRSLLKQFLIKEHDLYLMSINGFDLLDKDLIELIDRGEPKSFDLDLSYTQPGNFKTRFLKKSNLKLAIYNYESSILPKKWSDSHKYIDYVLPSSEYTKNVFLNAGWPEEKCLVIPHGIDLSLFETKNKYPLRTKKKFKFLNVSIPHYRKNIDLVIRAYYDLFCEEDDVCLVIKTNIEKKENAEYEYDFLTMLSGLQKEYLSKKKLPQVEIVHEKIGNMAALYNACDVLVSATSGEGFGLPLLEGLASNMVVIAPRATGQVDFLNDNNSLLYEANEMLADRRYQYISYHPEATVFMPSFEELKKNMEYAYDNFDFLKLKFEKPSKEICNKLTWSHVADQILNIS